MGEFRVLGTKYIKLYLNKVHDYITYNITFDVQKTHGWSPTPFSKCKVCNSRSGQGGVSLRLQLHCLFAQFFNITKSTFVSLMLTPFS